MLRQPRAALRRHVSLGAWRLMIFSSLIVYVGALWFAPMILNPTARENLTPQQLIDAEHNARVLTMSAAGAVFVGLGLIYTARNYHLSRRGQIVDRFSRALEQLESDEPYVRIGAIRSLEQVMRDAPAHHNDVMEILLAYLQRQSPVGRATSNEEPAGSSGGEQSQTAIGVDIQAALTTICRRPHYAEEVPLDFRNLNLRGAKLVRANLARADFNGSDLALAQLRQVDLNNVSMNGCDLRSARISESRLDDARFDLANLERVWIVNCSARRSSFAGATLRGNINNTDLREALLSGVVIEHAAFNDVNFRDARFDHGVTPAGELKLYVTHIGSVWFARCRFEGAELRGIDLSNAENLHSEDLAKAIIDAKTLVPDVADSEESHARWTGVRVFDEEGDSSVALVSRVRED